MDLFDFNKQKDTKHQPLAYLMRPQNLEEIVGQKHLLAPDKMLRKAIERDELHPFILYGPPGTGKTTIATLIAKKTNSHYETLQAVTSGVADIKKIAQDAKDRLRYYQQKTILFVDEIHRFNKSQQDVLLPFVEDGSLLLIGATTENPLYELNNALLSRLKIYILKALENDDIKTIILNALNDEVQGLGKYKIKIDEDSLNIIANYAKGDARLALNILDALVSSYMDNNYLEITSAMLTSILDKPTYKYDATGDYHYDTISAYIKSIRGSDPDAAIFWLAVMLEGGEDPIFIARRLVIQAAEDIGLADPRALPIAVATFQAVRVIGLPEARIPLAEATIYLATAPKSNSSLTAIDNAIALVRKINKAEIPAHIASNHHSQARNLLGKGADYKYPHNFGGYIKQNYWPVNIPIEKLYHSSSNGYEKDISSYIASLKKINQDDQG